MLHLKTTTALVAAGLLSASGAAFAEGNTQPMDNNLTRDYNENNMSQDNREWNNSEYSAIDDLPEEGNVALSGTVTDADPESNRFVLQDNSGETIDVHTAQDVDVNEGERVRVSGTIEDEALGMGEQIVSASVQRISSR